MQIKHKHILVPGQRYQYSRHLLQNPKVPRNVMNFNNNAHRCTPPYYLDVDNSFANVSNFFFHQKPPVQGKAGFQGGDNMEQAVIAA